MLATPHYDPSHNMVVQLIGRKRWVRSPANPEPRPIPKPSPNPKPNPNPHPSSLTPDPDY